MASSIIHMAVASEVNKLIKRDNNKILIGSIAPDISKLIGESKFKSHFLDSLDNDIPNINKFLNKYKDKMNDDFVMGYFIHLYTDYLWFNYFIPEFYSEPMITKLDGSVVKCTGNMLSLYIYNDYTNLNIQLLDEYNLDLKIFYNKIPEIDNIIEEIPVEKLNLIINKSGEIIANTKEKKSFVFDIKNIKNFIELSVELIIAKINEIDEKNIN